MGREHCRDVAECLIFGNQTLRANFVMYGKKGPKLIFATCGYEFEVYASGAPSQIALGPVAHVSVSERPHKCTNAQMPPAVDLYETPHDEPPH